MFNSIIGLSSDPCDQRYLSKLKEAYTVTTTAEPSCLSPSFTIPKIWYQMQYISLSNVREISVDLWKAEELPDKYGAQLKLKDAICHWRAITSAPAVVSFFCCCSRLFYYFIFFIMFPLLPACLSGEKSAGVISDIYSCTGSGNWRVISEEQAIQRHLEIGALFSLIAFLDGAAAVS